MGGDSWKKNQNTTFDFNNDKYGFQFWHPGWIWIKVRMREGGGSAIAIAGYEGRDSDAPAALVLGSIIGSI